MTRKERFEAHIREYFPRLSLKPGRLNDYANNYVQMAWFFYEQGLDDKHS